MVHSFIPSFKKGKKGYIMGINILRSLFFVLSISMVNFVVTGYSNEIENKVDPIVTKPANSEKKQVTVQVTKKKDIILADETETAYDKMSDSQIAQIKRYDCRLIKKILPHEYKKKTHNQVTGAKF
jgi:hypothetical protein